MTVLFLSILQVDFESKVEIIKDMKDFITLYKQTVGFLAW